MAIGPFVRIVAQLVVPLVATLARALPAAYQQALHNARRAGMDANTAAAASSILRRTMNKQEALRILNLNETEASMEAVQKVSTSECFFVFTTMFGDDQPRGSFLSFSLEKCALSCIVLYFQQYEKYMAANDVSRGGSFYLQSKVYRAKEMLDDYLNEQKMNNDETSTTSKPEQ